MVQSRLQTPISIQLTPMRIPEAVPQSSGWTLMNSGGMDVADRPGLLLQPDTPSEMMVQIQNLERHTLQVNLELKVEGNFPSEWFSIHTEGNEIAPGAQMDAVIYFQIPKSFFEGREAITPDGDRKLEIDFFSLLTIQIDRDTDRSKTYYEEFSLHIRPYSAYMDFLPVLYREVDFIGRFMKIFEQAFQPIIDSFEVMWANLDPLTAPELLLPFLSHWVGWDLDPILDLKQQRRLMRRAIELYTWRGTRRGLRLYLHLYTGLPLDEDILDENAKHISITEPIGESFVVGEAVIGEAILGGGRAFHFAVQLRPDSTHQIEEALVRKIIEQEKPAFCSYELLIISE
jgi:phage tail-like protein